MKIKCCSANIRKFRATKAKFKGALISFTPTKARVKRYERKLRRALPIGNKAFWHVRRRQISNWRGFWGIQ